VTSDGDRVAFVTGASSGIGAALARVLARRGVAVALAARRTDRLEAMARGIEGDGGRALAVRVDVGDLTSVRAGVHAAEAALGPIDLLVANAGISRHTDSVALDPGDLEAEIRTNALGAFFAMHAVVPGMLERGRGHVVAVSSVAGWIALPGEAGYAASKAWLTRLVESLRLDWRKRGVTTTIVHPGFVDTEIVADADHPMPFLMDADRAARRIDRAIRRRQKRCDFPRRMVWLVRLGRLLPDRLRAHLVERARYGAR
jgi:NADP-dependent 3-hydroxy acid dehydrogenase YdfG